MALFFWSLDWVSLHMRLILRLLLYILLISAMFISWLAWETDANQVRRWIYPVKGELAAWSTRCDTQAPRWLGTLARAMATAHDSPANQLAFVTRSGEISICTNGWESTPVLSPRLAPDTPMRLASLSKIVSFIGLTGVPAAEQAAWLDALLAEVLGLAPPYADARVGSIRVRDLLNHSAGFDRLKTEDPITRFRDARKPQRSWCPYELDRLARIGLDYAPGSRFSYHNLDYCLAAAAYEKRFGRSLWTALAEDFHLHDHGLEWLDRRDSPVAYNFMHAGLTSPDASFVQRLDWQAARAPMGLTGNAGGLARFIHAHRTHLALAQRLRDDTIPCDAAQTMACYDGFLNRVDVDGQRLWQQGGYLYGMAALFVLDEAGNFIVWLGAGEGRPFTAAPQRIRQALLKHE